jgi:hypothetical protein
MTNNDPLLQLHQDLATELSNRIKGAEVVIDVVRATAAELSVAATFLKNNNITAAPSEDGALGELHTLMEAKRKRRPLLLPDTLAEPPVGMH